MYLAYLLASNVHPTWQAHLLTAGDDSLPYFAPQAVVFLAAAAYLSLAQMQTTPLSSPAQRQT